MHPLFPHLLVVCVVLLTMILFALRSLFYGPFKPPEKVNPNTSLLVPTFIANWTFWCLGYAVKVLIRLRFTPNRVTAASALFGCLAGISFASGWFAGAGWLIILSGAFDMMDGWLARSTGQMSRAGGFIDSVADRYVEIFLYLGLSIYWRDHWWMMFLCALAITGAIMVSYTRARGESMGVLYKKGLFQRGERMFFLAIVTTFTPFIQLLINPEAERPFYAPVALVVIATAVMANIGALQRFRAIAQLINSDEQKPAEQTEKQAG